MKPHPAGDHLHFELWHWVTPTPRGDTDTKAVPVDPTRLLYHWEQALELDYAVLGSVDVTASAELDTETVGPGVTAAYAGAGIDLPAAARITMSAPRCVWRITGTDVTHLLRSERGSITVIEEAYGHRTVGAASLNRIGMTRRCSYPTFLLEADGITYGIPMHQAARSEEILVDLVRCAYADRTPVELEIRRSAFWRMDGSLDEFAAAVTGIRLG